MADNLQQRIDQAASGTPLLKPDEQRIYLGTFRERCYVSMTIAQMKKTSNQTALKKALKTYPGASILMNGCLSTVVQSTYMQIATKENIPFKIVTTTNDCDDQSIGLLVISDKAVHQEILDIEVLFPSEKPVSSIQKKKEKEPFWRKIF